MCPKPTNSTEAGVPLPGYNKAIFWGIGGLFVPFVAPVAVILSIKGLKKHVPQEARAFKITTTISLVLGAMGSTVLFFFIILLPGMKDAVKTRSESQSAHTAGESMSLEHQLAVINAGYKVSEDDVTVARFSSLRNQLSQTFVENKQEIVNATIHVQKMLKDRGISESVLTIMGGMNQLVFVKAKDPQYAEYTSAYVLLRDKGQSHAEAIAGLEGILRGLGL